jgi:hypothetical protein
MKNLLTMLAILGLATAERLLVASVTNCSSASAIQTLDLLPISDDSKDRKLDVIHKNHNCDLSPTWPDTSLGYDTIVCLDESGYFANLTNLTNLTTLSLGPDGSLNKSSAITVMTGTVSMTTYNN